MIWHSAIYLARDYDKAFFYMQKSLETEKEFAVGHYNLSEMYEITGKYDEAVAEWLKGMAFEEIDQADINILETAYRGKDFRHFAQAKAAWLEKTRGDQDYILATDIAKGYIGADDHEKALARLEIAYEERSPDLIFIGHSPAYDQLRSEPRFLAILKKMNF